MKSDPVITYNHMEEENSKSKMKHIRHTFSGKIIYLLELLGLGALLWLMFYLF